MAHKKMNVDNRTVADRTLDLDTLFRTSIHSQSWKRFDKDCVGIYQGAFKKKKKKTEGTKLWFFHLLPFYCNIN